MTDRDRKKSAKSKSSPLNLSSGSNSEPERVSYDEFKIMDAWERFLAGDNDHQGQANVRPIIQDSWLRSASKGINAQFERSPQNLGRDEVQYKREKRTDLLTAAARTFNELAQKLNGSDAILILTDQDGIILNAVGDKATLNAGREINLEVGGVWNEGAVGTNGIGTALWTGKPVFVHAAEHFCAGIKAWSCAGAPIHDPVDGSVIGVIDLSGPPAIFEERNAALITSAAQEIESALASLRYNEWAKLLDSFFEVSGGVGPGDGVILLDQFGRVAFHHASSPKSRTNISNSGITQGQKLLPNGVNMTSSEIFAALPSELKNCSVNILSKDGVQGAVLVIPAKKSVRKGIAQPASTQNTKTKSKIIGQHPEILEKIDMVERLATSKSDAALLIEGETGVGKELFAKLMHEQIQANGKCPFVVVNCGAISKELFGGELFGHTSGSFTGALKEGKPGKFELANGGVIALDEIGEMPYDIQPYLLRVLEERVVYRIGEDKGRPVNVKLIASTNRILEDDVKAGRFRQDLFYRISAVTVRIPPLRDRGDDIILLADYFNNAITAESGNEPLIFCDQVYTALLNHSWPGNVRELKNLVERLHILLHHRKVRLSDLPNQIIEPEQTKQSPLIQINSSHTPMMTANNLEEAEKETIMRILEEKNGNLSQVAKSLGISRPTLYRKLDRYDIRRHFG